MIRTPFTGQVPKEGNAQMKWTKEEKIAYAKKHLAGEPAGCPPGWKRKNFRNMVRYWASLYERFGAGAFDRRRAIPPDERLSAVMRVLGGESLTQVARSLGLLGTESLRSWRDKYLKGGPEAIDCNRGRASPMPKKPPKKTAKEKELEDKIRRLEIENLYLKKLNALVREREDRRRPRKPKPSASSGSKK